MVERYWFFTWRTYGTWLPGEDGFVGDYRSPNGRRVRDNAPGTDTTPPIPALARFAHAARTRPPVFLTPAQAEAVEGGLLRTCDDRRWVADVIAVVPNHVHMLFGGPGDPDSNRTLAELKAYCSRVLNKLGGGPGGRWWAEGGSRRRVKGDTGREEVGEYLRTQPGALRVWTGDEARVLSDAYLQRVREGG